MAVAPAATRRRVSPVTMRNTLTGLAFCLPWIIGLLAFRAYPIGAAFWYSLTDYQGMNPPEFIGADNYRRIELWTRATTGLVAISQGHPAIARIVVNRRLTTANYTCYIES